jgi:Domain of unknown function (DUF5666)
MKTNHWTFRLIAFVMAICVASCGGGGGGGGTQVAGGGTGGTGISSGSVSQFGSIFVNGVEFNTNSATYTRDDASFTRTAGQLDSDILKLGMTVEVQGSFTNSTSGVANTVKVQEIVRGKLEARSNLSATDADLIILGQTVHVDDTTKYDSSTSFAAMLPGHVLEVHGKRSADGSILASYIERKIALTTFSVRGTVSGHSAAAHTFAISGLTVDYTNSAAVFIDMPAPVGNNWNGLFVSVRGSTCSGVSPLCGTLTATKVEPTGLGLASGATQAELEGFVTKTTSISALASDFTVDFQRVLTTASTIYSGGVFTDILTGTKLEVEGSLSGGVITATKVRFKDSVVIDGNATVLGSTVSIEGLPGVTVAVNAFTDLSNANSATVSNLAPLNGESVRIRGRANPNVVGGVIATRIQDHGPRNTNGNMSLLAFVAGADVNDPLFAMLGLTVDTSSLVSNTDFRDVHGTPISRGSFFGALTPKGGLVMATSRLPQTVNAFAASQLKEVQLGDD